MKAYNGHRSWNAWNISLWISNDEPLYRFALGCIESAREWANDCREGYWKTKKRKQESILTKATRSFMKYYQGEKTPDGATYNTLSVKLCLKGLIED
jgi:hypothetical protein